MPFRELSTRRLRGWLENDPKSVFILDVRQPFEFDVARIEPSKLIPLNQLPGRLGEVPQNVRVVCLCHHGIRSAHACAMLARAGWERIYNLSGGIDQWSMSEDPAVPRY